MSRIRVGTAGWHYPSGRGRWNGLFYPASGSRPAGFDELAFYARYFDTVEVNATFYGQPQARVTRSWATRTPPDFVFAVKLYQKFTHPAMFAEAIGSQAGGEGLPPEALAELTRVSRGDLDVFRAGIAPLADAGKLGPLLAQFPPSFTDTPAARAYLAWLLDALREHETAVELRHRSWSDKRADTLALLGDFGAAWVQIDEPKFRFSIQQDFRPNNPGLFYMRLHGRNAAQWWHHDQPEDRYNYLYSPAELAPVVGSIETSRALVKKLYVYLNNHFAAKAVVNAAQMRQQLGQQPGGAWPSALVARYPELSAIGATPDSLFPPAPDHGDRP